mmetsp:Transcript_121568/g.294998  ORF Transcript_121568/g.294998 Transcript_121568/m.294998 type:complete len:99 (+) Transcript_121568:347-643(+)
MAAKYDPRFAMFASVHVNGPQESPLYSFLKDAMPVAEGGKSNGKKPVRHNFEKFLCDASGTPVRRFDPSVPPLDFEDEIVALLDAVASPAKRKRSSKK